MTPDLVIRAPNSDSELRFIRSSWFRSYQKPSGLAFDVYEQGQGRLIERLLEGCAVHLATPLTVQDEVCGWVCWRGPVLHYAYVKQAYRRLGIAAKLLESIRGAGDVLRWHTCETVAGRRLVPRSATRYNPYLLQTSGHDGQ